MKEIIEFKSSPSIIGDITFWKKENGFRLVVGKEGGRIRFDGEVGKLGGADWSEDKILVIPIKYDAIHSYYFGYHLYNVKNEFVRADFSTLPYVDVKVAFPLTCLNLETVFMPRTPGRLKNMMHGTPMKASDVTAFEIFIPPSSYECEIYCDYPYLTDEMPKDSFDDEPQLDEFGQWVRKDFAGKTKSREELNAYLNNEVKKEFPEFSEKRSKFGGDLSLKREGTGFFRIHKENDTYWFCDPEGYLMFSSGADLIVPQEYSPTKDLECLFGELPPKDGVFEAVWTERDNSVSHLTSNLIHAFGENWYKNWAEISKNRVKSWGFNTIANWADNDFNKNAKISYVMQGDFPKTKKTLFRSMPDVFSTEYKENADKCASYLEERKDDPYMIGYFMRNEPDWAFGEYNIASIMLEKEEDFATKSVLVADLYLKYKNVKELNQAWGTNFSQIEDLKKPIKNLQGVSNTAENDLWDFTRRIIREYVRVPAQAYKMVDKNHLNLGLRWGWLSTDNLVIGCEYCDVFSINCYKEWPDKDHFTEIHKMTNKPLLIGEFQVGSLDVGHMANGMYGVTKQSERGVFYQKYMEMTASLPFMLGAHYFQWNDQPVLGRFDGENLNLGLVDVCNRPYDDFIEGIKIANARLNKVHSGEIPPTERKSELVPKEGF